MEISGNCLVVNVKSLNHAYTAASLRLQPNRRSHGGRVYDHLAVKQDKDFKPLEAIRVEQEKGYGRNWRMESSFAGKDEN